MPEIINILFLSAEATPFIKIGGLADVAGALPKALRSLTPRQTGGYCINVRLVLPLHRLVKAGLATLKLIKKFSILVDGDLMEAHAYESSENGFPIYFIDGQPISRSEMVYSDNPENDREKYAFFSLASLELARLLNWNVDVVHANDWHTALSIYTLRTSMTDNYYSKTAGLLTIHNLPYMGGKSGELLGRFGIPDLRDISIPVWARDQFLPMGIWASDAIVPVSETYAREILTPVFGCGLQDFLKERADSITGITNGLDVQQWDPATDKFLTSNYDLTSLESRRNNKIALLKKVDLDFNDHLPLIGMVTRIDYQKGIDLLIQALSLIMERRWQLIILGSGDESLENELSQMQARYPDRIRLILRFDNPLSRLIYAGSDIFLMPSRYEPCGLSQMIAMRYGSVPIVHATGGLKDTVLEGKTGFSFGVSDPASQADALIRALNVFEIPAKWKFFQRNGMKQDFSWTRSAQKYSILYRSITNKYLSGGNQ